MNTEAFPDLSAREPANVAVDADKLRELHDTYALYRMALVEPWDPVRVLRMTGDVMAAVRRVVTDPGLGIRR